MVDKCHHEPCSCDRTESMTGQLLLLLLLLLLLPHQLLT